MNVTTDKRMNTEPRSNNGNTTSSIGVIKSEFRATFLFRSFKIPKAPQFQLVGRLESYSTRVLLQGEITQSELLDTFFFKIESKKEAFA